MIKYKILEELKKTDVGLSIECLNCGNSFVKGRKRKCPWCGEDLVDRETIENYK